jgi:hypothetical protein
MNPLIQKRLLKLWDAYHLAEKKYEANQYQDISGVMLASYHLAEITTRFSTAELFKQISDWDFTLWLRNDERIICEQKHIKRPDRSSLPMIEWNGKTTPTLKQPGPGIK